MTLTRNTAWNNGDMGFVFKSSNSVLTSNIAALNVGSSQASLISGVQASGNSWNVGGTWANSTFKSVDPSTLKGVRQASGAVQGSNFLIPTSGAAIGATTL
jgi:parallel beta-helix repeat protein